MAGDARAPLHVGYVVPPPAPTFVANEIRAVRETGVRVTILNSFRSAEGLDVEGHEYGIGAALSASAVAAARSPLALGGAGLYALRYPMPGRAGGAAALPLACHYARLVRRLGIDHLHAHFSSMPGDVARLTSRLSGVPYSMTCHANDVFLDNPALARKVNDARAVACTSDHLAAEICRKHPRVDRSRLRTIHLGVDLDRFPERGGRPHAAATPAIVSVARLVPMKGLEVLVDACARLAAAGVPFVCRIAGEGSARDSLEARIERHGLGGRVSLLGHVDFADVPALLASADVFALPCQLGSDNRMDGLPVAMMEAMAVGLPVVSTRATGVPELVEDGASGYLVAEGDAEGVADRLARLLADPESRREMGARGRRIVEARFDLRESASSMVAMFRECAR